MYLTPRARLVGIIMAVFVGACLLFEMVISPAAERVETLSRVIPEKRKMLEEVRRKSEQYLALKRTLDAYKTKTASEQTRFGLLVFLETIINELELKNKVAAMRQDVLPLDSEYQEVLVEVKLQDTTLKQLVDFLYRIKSSNDCLRVKSLYTGRDASNPNALDTVIRISTLKSGEPV